MDRKKYITELREQGLSFGKIGKQLGISQQRVYQIYQKRIPIPYSVEKLVYTRDFNECQWQIKCKNDNENLFIHHIDSNERNNTLDNLITLCSSCHAYFHLHINFKGRDAMVEKMKRRTKKICPKCKKEFETKLSRPSKFCSKNCLKHNRTPEEQKEFNRKRTNEYSRKHRNDERFKAKIKQYNKTAYKKRMNNPEKLKEFQKKQNEYQKHRYNTDSEYRKKVLNNQKNK